MLLLALTGATHASPAPDTPRALADFSNASTWHVSASDDVTGRLRGIDGEQGKALCLDYDLNGTAGYASLRRTLPITFPANYAIDLGVRGTGANTLQFKLLDASGDNVWWHTWTDFIAPSAWTDLHVAKDHIAFAWGPRKDHALSHSAQLELTIAAGTGDGKGSVCFDSLTLTKLPPVAEAKPAPPSLDNNPNAYFETLAGKAPRGHYPRGFSGQQVYWTLVGIDGGHDSGLLSEDGALEVGKGGFTLEPFLLDNGKLVTWADTAITHGLRDGYLPIPSATWQHDGLTLRVTAFGAGVRGDARLIARYDVSNDRDTAREVTLVLAARPFQVDPPTQFLNAAGGVSPIHQLAWQRDSLLVDGKPRVRLLQPAAMEIASTQAQGSIVRRLARRDVPKAHAVDDPTGYASGAALYRLQLPPHATRTLGVVVPLEGPPLPKISGDIDPKAWLQHEEDAVAAAWRGRLDRVTLRLPPPAQRIADTLRSSLAWMLISRDGPELRPGTRSYARSWIRDGAMMSDALLRLGDVEAARDYALWYAPHQFKTGKVPCCVDARGADPTPENDSPGELLHLIAQAYRYSGDHTFLEKMWPHVTATVAYAHGLIESQSGTRCHEPATRMFCGLLPASISHEGYSAHPEHSYWDDFWMLTGYGDAIEIARAIGRANEVDGWTRQRDRFRDDLFASIRASAAAHHIDYIPGSAELGDFDPTSTTIALEPAGQLQNLARNLPPTLLHDTFARYWRESEARMGGCRDWSDYTPYEWRNVGAFARLGWRDRIPAMLDFFFDSVRPQGWNGWAEVVGRDARKPRFLGDLPHAWVASDYIRAALDLFAYQRYADHALVLAAGVQPAWLDDGGITLAGLHTPWGTLGYTLKRDGNRVIWHIDTGVTAPGGVVLTWPLPGTPDATRINGKPATWSTGELHIRELPATVIVETSASVPANPSASQSPPCSGATKRTAVPRRAKRSLRHRDARCP